MHDTYEASIIRHIIREAQDRYGVIIQPNGEGLISHKRGHVNPLASGELHFTRDEAVLIDYSHAPFGSEVCQASYFQPGSIDMEDFIEIAVQFFCGER
jgi:hypothetical protein